ncbi:YycH family regulatory protein [Bacillus sp. JJ722]|uniref:YycH family regulatory protein n=1 Tax=Bacillus sp. JJ722 TaxID=3122973 RepID=UPI003000DB08
MNKEAIKTIVLTLLVSSSVFLTWSIWTYSPNIETMDPKNLIPEVAISNKKQVSEIIKPSLIMFHDEENHYGSTSDETINMVLNEMSDWTFYDFKDVTSNVPAHKFQDFIHKTGMSELVFTDSIPFSLYRKVIKVEDRELRGDNIEFDRILIGSGLENGEKNEVYFVSTEKQRIYKFSVSASDLKDLARQMEEESKKLDHYKVIQVTASKYLYVPENKGQYYKYKYHAELLDVSKFKNALFPDPTVVKSDKTTRGEEFTDGSTIMKVYNDKMVLEYVNPGLKYSYATALPDLIERSISFINEHSGWEDSYRFAELNEEEQKSVFRLYVNGLPTFSDLGMSEIVLTWVDDELSNYSRPYFSLDFAFQSEKNAVTLPSGEEIFQELKKSPEFEPEFEPELLQDLTIGYKMVKDMEETQSLFVSLEPAWFYKYDGKWEQFTSDQNGGMGRGLE